MRGYCLSCTRIADCVETSVEKVKTDYTCLRYEPVEEAVFRAREFTIAKYGDSVAIQAMLNRPQLSKGDDDE
jgi:hypothetical protein